VHGGSQSTAHGRSMASLRDGEKFPHQHALPRFGHTIDVIPILERTSELAPDHRTPARPRFASGGNLFSLPYPRSTPPLAHQRPRCGIRPVPVARNDGGGPTTLVMAARPQTHSNGRTRGSPTMRSPRHGAHVGLEERGGERGGPRLGFKSRTRTWLREGRGEKFERPSTT
jgi:hypothetical protein